MTLTGFISQSAITMTKKDEIYALPCVMLMRECIKTASVCQTSALDMGRTPTLKFGAPAPPASPALSDISGWGGNKEEPALPNSTRSALTDLLLPTHT